MSASHWEPYYRRGALAACPTGPDPNYTLEMRDIWTEFFAGLADGAQILDVGTGNGAIALIARETGERLGRRFHIHGTDLARIDPGRDVPGGARLFAGVRFHPGVATEQLPFDADSFAAVSGQYAIEYTDMVRSLSQVLRVLQPGCRAQFLLHHAASIIVERARASLRHADAVLMETKVFRKLRRLLELQARSPGAARRAGQELRAAMTALDAHARQEPDRRIINVTLDAVPKLLGLSKTMSPSALAREIDSVENDIRHSVHRLKDLVAAAFDDPTMGAHAHQAQQLGFSDVTYRPVHHAARQLVGWQLCLRKPA